MIVTIPRSNSAVRLLGVDVLGEPDEPPERAVLDLHLLVDAAVDLRPRAVAADHERPLADDDADALRVDAGKLDHDRELVRVVGVVAVDVGAEARAQAREARHLPEVGEELLDHLVQLVAVPPRHRL